MWPRPELFEDRRTGLKVCERWSALAALRGRFGALPQDARLAEAITDGARSFEGLFPASLGGRIVAQRRRAGPEPSLERWTHHLAVNDESELMAALERLAGLPEATLALVHVAEHPGTHDGAGTGAGLLGAHDAS